ncbi:MAG: hypothetical protein NZ750_14150 [Anaerolineae bacterium]|nr:hypothetical protein [Anaerolineae bacterium]MDW8173744.1 hypothetical protein [Anaerolineae bacterium]
MKSSLKLFVCLLMGLTGACSAPPSPTAVLQALTTPTAQVQGALRLDEPVQGQMTGRGRHEWTLRAEGGQQLRFDVSADWLVFMDILSSDGTLVGRQTAWQTTAQDGVYRVVVEGRYGDGPYRLSVSWLNRPTSTPTPSPTPTSIPATVTPIPLGAGDVQVTLRWFDTDADLDLYVTDPGGTTISFNNTRSPSGGELDVDVIPCNRRTERVENIFWPSGRSPRGTYVVGLHYHPSCRDLGVARYEITVRVVGREPQVFTGTIRYDERLSITSFSR